MTRENIISLAKSCDCGYTADENDVLGSSLVGLAAITAFYHAAIADFLKSSGQYLTNDASREACIKQAKLEAFERAAVACDCMADGWENNPGNNPMAGYVASSNCAAAIREMAKEMK